MQVFKKVQVDVDRFELKRHRDNGQFGTTHQVVVHLSKDQSHLYVTCTCKGGQFAFSRGRDGSGCWAMKDIRQQLGWNSVFQFI